MKNRLDDEGCFSADYYSIYTTNKIGKFYGRNSIPME